jgi:hypothetical protein
MHLNDLGAFFTLQKNLKFSKMLNKNQYYSSFEPLKKGTDACIFWASVPFAIPVNSWADNPLCYEYLHKAV